MATRDLHIPQLPLIAAWATELHNLPPPPMAWRIANYAAWTGLSIKKKKKNTQAMWTRWWYSGRSLFTANANDSPQNYVLKPLATCSCNVILGYYIFLTKSSCSFKHSRGNFVCWKVLQIVNSWQRCVCSWHQKPRASIRQIKMTQQIFVSFDPT